MTALQNNTLFQQLTRILNEVSQGNTTNVETIFELTKEGVYPPEIVNLAESFGMLIVNIEAKQQRLERLLTDLQDKNRELEQVSSSLLNANIGMLEVLGSAIAKRDSDTCAHNYRVCIYSIHLGKALGLPDDSLRSLIKGAFLHDIGKIAISDTILLKPGGLDDREYEIIKTHVLHGSEIIRAYSWLSDAHDVVLHHHERYNGEGYPDRLKAEQIPLHARVFSICDVFDALTSKRPYKEPYPVDYSLRTMRTEVGSHFDPEIFDLFVQNARTMYETIVNFSENQLESRLHTIMQDYFAPPEKIGEKR
ncbi:HD domain-containing protein [Trichlorobacter thiogenes]|uniref:HD domain-containing protein n=1 Tax=Trichlorobacter thiogenes TaxID=115783 RepID=A0A1T4Q3D1_9BACT|nr:HD-GYP domain-containing protein [Trichlorobacter thiogenes]SJZ98335.1 HD domain-containing protein [Trichlorobacter thiogenes]